MKTLVACLLALGLVAPLAAQTPKSPSQKTAPASKSSKQKGAKQPKTEEEAPKIEGIEISRGDRGYLGVQIVQGGFRINFYDIEKKPMEPDVTRAALRWDPKYKLGLERAVLTPTGDGKSLSSPKHVRPPYNFKLYIVLLKDAGEGQEPISETHVIDFRQAE